MGCESLSNYDEEKSNSVISARRIRDESDCGEAVIHNGATLDGLPEASIQR